MNAEVPTAPLVESLTMRGWDVDEVVAYRTVRAAPPPEAVCDGIKRGRYDAVLFSSSSTVRNLVGIAGKPHGTTGIVCVGEKTALTARSEEHTSELQSRGHLLCRLLLENKQLGKR